MAPPGPGGVSSFFYSTPPHVRPKGRWHIGEGNGEETPVRGLLYKYLVIIVRVSEATNKFMCQPPSPPARLFRVRGLQQAPRKGFLEPNPSNGFALDFSVRMLEATNKLMC